MESIHGKSKLLIVGKNSFIGKNLHQRFESDIISYNEFEHVNLNNYDCVLNCAITDEYRNKAYKENNDLDLKLIRRVNEFNKHFIMLSSRKVYGSSEELQYYEETNKLEPFDYYSQNKVFTEIKLSQFENVSILRCSNVFGEEYGRNSFFGYCLTKLKNEGIITFTISDRTIKDFIPIDDTCILLNEVYKQKPKGIYNLSLGQGVSVGGLARKLIEGFGRGELIITSDKPDQQFILTNDKLFNELKLQKFDTNVLSVIKNIGEKL